MTHGSAVPHAVAALLRGPARSIPAELLEELAQLAEGAAAGLEALAAAVRGDGPQVVEAAAELTRVLLRLADVEAAAARLGGAS